MPIRWGVAALLAIALGGCQRTTSLPDVTGPTMISIGDSYASGFVPALDGEEPTNTTDGFAWGVAHDLDLDLVNFGCAGITAGDFVDGDPCPEWSRAPDGPTVVGQSQADAVLDLLAAHGDDVRLVTVVLGGNDIQECLRLAEPMPCARAASDEAAAALDELLGAIRERLEPDVPIVGVGYADAWTAAPVVDPDSSDLADRTVAVFRDVFNPTLASVYERHGALTADVATDFGAFLPADRTVTLEPWGTIPARAELACRLTYFCTENDPHPNPEGHRRIADLVLSTLDR